MDTILWILDNGYGKLTHTHSYPYSLSMSRTVKRHSISLRKMQQLLLSLARHGSIILLYTWNWLSDSLIGAYRITKRSVKGIVDANREETYVFYDSGLPFVTRALVFPGTPLCTYKPSTKTFFFTQNTSPVKHRYSFLSAQLVGHGTNDDLSEFFAEVGWIGSVTGPTFSQVLIAAFLPQGRPPPLSTSRLEIEDEMGVKQMIVDFTTPAG